MSRISFGIAIGAVALLGALAGAQPAASQAPADAGAQRGGRGRPGGPGAPAPAGGQGRGRGFDAAAIARATPLYEEKCGFCHGNDARGRAGGPDLGRSLVVLEDTGGRELAGFLHAGRPDRGMPAFPELTDQQIADIAEFLHQQFAAAKSRTATDPLVALVGDAQAGAAYFKGSGRCVTCHSPTGDLAHIASKYNDPLTLQDRIVNPRAGGGRGSGPTSERATRTVTVTLPNGQTVSGALDFVSEFAVTLVQRDGTRRSFKREGDVPKAVITDPLQAHFDKLRTFRDKDMHDLTAYLWTLK